MSLRYRSEEQEWMDDLQCEGEGIDQTLKELGIINKWLGGDHVTINGIAYIIGKKNLQNKVVSIADLGCGGGDLLIKIAKWARKNEIKVKLTGIDANPYIINYAKNNTQRYNEIEYRKLNIFSPEFQNLKFDIITSTLFTHHFNEIELCNLYKQFYAQVDHGILTNDIHRHFLAYHSIQMLTRFFSKSEMVKNDASLSVRRAFKSAEIKKILSKAELHNYRLKWMWAFRWQIIILKNEFISK